MDGGSMPSLDIWFFIFLTSFYSFLLIKASIFLEVSQWMDLLIFITPYLRNLSQYRSNHSCWHGIKFFSKTTGDREKIFLAPWPQLRCLTNSTACAVVWSQFSYFFPGRNLEFLILKVFSSFPSYISLTSETSTLSCDWVSAKGGFSEFSPWAALLGG